MRLITTMNLCGFIVIPKRKARSVANRENDALQRASFRWGASSRLLRLLSGAHSSEAVSADALTSL